jgi:ribonuclease HI
MKVESDYLWQHKKQRASEVMLIMDSIESKFSEIEALIKKTHSYETFVLTAYTMARYSDGVRQWLDKELNKDQLNMKLDEAKLYTDGGSRGNPGPSAAAYVICKMDDSVVEKSGFYMGTSTNNKAEYQGLRLGLERSKELGVRKLFIYMDSQLVVNQINGLYKVKNVDLAPVHQEATALLKLFEEFSLSYVPRAMNKLADKEVNRILDEQKVL